MKTLSKQKNLIDILEIPMFEIHIEKEQTIEGIIYTCNRSFEGEDVGNDLYLDFDLNLDSYDEQEKEITNIVLWNDGEYQISLSDSEYTSILNEIKKSI
jgi:predicted transport protein